jgi:hypothetical protein
MAWAQQAQQKKQRAMLDAATMTACLDACRGLDQSHCAWLGSPEHWSAPECMRLSAAAADPRPPAALRLRPPITVCDCEAMIPQLRHLAVSPSATRQTRQFATSSALRRAFQAGDVVLLREKTTQNGPLVKLRADGVTHGHRGIIKHADVIGKKARHAVQSSKGTVYRVVEPTLADYVRLTPRLVTPVRPACLCASSLAQSTERS